MAKSFMVNGKFVLPTLSPSCFGIAVPYSLTSEDIENSIQAYGEEEVIGQFGIGDTIDCAIYTVRDTPYAQDKRKNSKPKQRVSKKMDYCVLANKGKPGTQERLNALQEFYSKLPIEKQIEHTEHDSPFSRPIEDIAEFISKAAVGRVYDSFSKNEIE